MLGNKLRLDLHAKSYIEAMFEAKLREAGFACPDENKICWYRVKSGRIVNSIVFFSYWNQTPISLTCGFGIHPLFAKPVYTSSFVYPDRPVGDVALLSDNFGKQGGDATQWGYFPFSKDVLVLTTGSKDEFGIESVILPTMEKILTIEECYLQHKKEVEELFGGGAESAAKGFSGTIVDEALWCDDRDMYPYCVERSQDMIAQYKKLVQMKPKNRVYANELQMWKRRLDVLRQGNREDYIAILETKKNENIKHLKIKLHLDW